MSAARQQDKLIDHGLRSIRISFSDVILALETVAALIIMSSVFGTAIPRRPDSHSWAGHRAASALVGRDADGSGHPVLPHRAVEAGLSGAGPEHYGAGACLPLRRHARHTIFPAEGPSGRLRSEDSHITHTPMGATLVGPSARFRGIYKATERKVKSIDIHAHLTPQCFIRAMNAGEEWHGVKPGAMHVAPERSGRRNSGSTT